MNRRSNYSLYAILIFSLFATSPLHKSFANEGGEGATANKQFQNKPRKKKSVGGNVIAIKKIDLDIARLEKSVRDLKVDLSYRDQEVLGLKKQIVTESAKSKSTTVEERRLKNQLRGVLLEVDQIEASIRRVNRQIVKLEKERKKY